MKTLLGEPFYVETKFDGERIQVHFDEENIRLFSRNCHEVTDIYAPALSASLRESIKAKAAILDGEVVVVDRLTHKPQAFGLNKQVALEEASENGNAESSNARRLQLCCKMH